MPPVADWSGSSLATISFGHGISTTPLALARAYAAIANGGLLLRPRLVHALDDENGNVDLHVRSGDRAPGDLRSDRREAAPDPARGRRLRNRQPDARTSPGYTTAGKTGTAQVVENGRYEPGEYIASFIGYVPAEAPRYVILVKIDRPRGAYYGSVVAAPVFADARAGRDAARRRHAERAAALGPRPTAAKTQR